MHDWARMWVGRKQCDVVWGLSFFLQSKFSYWIWMKIVPASQLMKTADALIWNSGTHFFWKPVIGIIQLHILLSLYKYLFDLETQGATLGFLETVFPWLSYNLLEDLSLYIKFSRYSTGKLIIDPTDSDTQVISALKPLFWKNHSVPTQTIVFSKPHKSFKKFSL